MEISAFGFYARGTEIVFEPIATTTPAERVTILSQLSTSMVALYQSGLISKESALEEMQSIGKELGAFSHLEPGEDKPLSPPAPPASPPDSPASSTNEILHPLDSRQ